MNRLLYFLSISSDKRAIRVLLRAATECCTHYDGIKMIDSNAGANAGLMGRELKQTYIKRFSSALPPFCDHENLCNTRALEYACILNTISLFIHENALKYVRPLILMEIIGLLSIVLC